MSIVNEWFGPSRDEIWRQLCKQTGATFIDGGFWGKKKVEANHGEWTITLDVYAVSSKHHTSYYTRFRAPYINADDFRFKIYREGFVSTVAKKLNMIQDVIVGYEEFDENFVIQGNNETKLKEFFQNDHIRELLGHQYDFELNVLDDEGFWEQRFPSKADLITYKSYGVIQDIDRLKQLFFLFSEILDQLCKIGSAYKDYPGVKIN